MSRLLPAPTNVAVPSGCCLVVVGPLTLRMMVLPVARLV
jgi:hypothetical protein